MARQTPKETDGLSRLHSDTQSAQVLTYRVVVVLVEDAAALKDHTTLELAKRQRGFRILLYENSEKKKGIPDAQCTIPPPPPRRASTRASSHSLG